MSSICTDVPSLEHEWLHDASHGFEPPGEPGAVRCLEQGFATPPAHWHYHPESEVQLILASCGQAFVGDYVGTFEPGHLVLTGPRLPHHWIPSQTTAQADPVDRLVIQFQEISLRRALDCVPELADLDRLLHMSQHGVEFFGFSQQAREHFLRIKNARGTRRFAEFLSLLSELAASQDFRLMSTAPIALHEGNAASERIQRVIQHVHEHHGQPIPMADVHALAGMNPGTFARAFAKATGMPFTRFVSHARIAKAAELLLHTNAYVGRIAHDVGFNNLAHFNRQFAQVKKMTPSEFRRARRPHPGSDARR